MLFVPDIPVGALPGSLFPLAEDSAENPGPVDAGDAVPIRRDDPCFAVHHSSIWC